jgi:long-subunit fatty acid transport protein
MLSLRARLHGWVTLPFGSFLILAAILASSSFAQEGGIDFTSSPNPLGSGARALGMGGAFIAIADDATAASWNPGGLVQLERPEVSAVGEAVGLKENNQFKERPEGSGEQRSKSASLNYLSAAYPFTFADHNMIVSFNYQHLYDFSRSWQIGFLATDPYAKSGWNYKANGGLYAYGLAYAIQLIPQLSFGFTLNFWQDGIYQNGWQTQTIWHGVLLYGKNLRYTADYVRNDHYSFDGFNANLGFLWNITDKLNMGVVFKSPFTASVTHDFNAVTTENYSGRKRQPAPYLEGGTDYFDLGMPMSYGLGFAYRFSDRLTVSADVYRTEWGDFLVTTPDGNQYSALSGLPRDQSHVSATNQAHLGAEYLFIWPKYTIPVRAGFFYDPGPAENSPDNYYGFSVGTGIGIGRFVFDLAYVYRFGNDVKKTLVEGVTFSQNVVQHAIYSSLIIHF